MAASAAARAILISRAADSSLQPTLLPRQAPVSRCLLIRPLLPVAPKKRLAISCLISGVGGGGVSDEFVSTRKSSFGREFSVIANMLKRIEPLDNSVISKGVSDSAKDSMKETISAMLGLLPSDQFSVTVRVAKHPLDRLIASSIITGYTLWNAEYRISLRRNFNISLGSSDRSDATENGVSEVNLEEREGGGDEQDDGNGVEGCAEELEGTNLQKLGDLSPEALNYIQQLELELTTAKQELHAQKQQNSQMEDIKKSNNNNLLEYLRSLESNMVSEMSRPSSPEVDMIIHQLAQNILQRFFKDETTSDNEHDLAISSIQNHPDDESCDTISTSRDYLAKLLFWCMLLGHHLRGLENRLHLSCVVGLL